MTSSETREEAQTRRHQGRDSRRGHYWLAALVVPLIFGPLWILGSRILGPPGLLGTLSGFVLFLLLVVTTWTDLERRKIPNWATYSALLWSFAINTCVAIAARLGSVFWVESLGGVNWLDGLLGALVCFALMLVAYQFAGGGAGDVKLATAIGGLLGIQRGLDVLLTSYLLAGILLGCWTVWVVGPFELFGGLARSVGSRLFPGHVAPPSTGQQRLLKRPIPLAAFFCAGTFLVLADWGALQ